MNTDVCPKCGGKVREILTEFFCADLIDCCWSTRKDSKNMEPENAVQAAIQRIRELEGDVAVLTEVINGSSALEFLDKYRTISDLESRCRLDAQEKQIIKLEKKLRWVFASQRLPDAGQIVVCLFNEKPGELWPEVFKWPDKPDVLALAIKTLYAWREIGPYPEMKS